ncbi:MAG: flavin reductase family protein [Candidatus Rokubacteria bacterium]|nr:flavin reductase family protein [Candidatus Rokubacteria bacterium]
MAIGPDEFRRVLGHFASGVTVVTTWEADGRPTGLTASAFTSVSLTPPLVLICVDQNAQSYQALLAQGRFAVNILAANQDGLSRHFATTQANKFERIAFQKGARGLPLLPAALAHLECRTVHTYPGGDHTIFVGEVEAASVGEGEPLLYYCGGYTRVGAGSLGS